MKDPVKNTLYLIGYPCCIYTGLGMLGVIGGWTNTDTIFSKAMGAGFVYLGLNGLWTLLRKLFVR